MILPLMPDCCKLNAVSAPSAIIVILGSFAFRFAIVINDPLILPIVLRYKYLLFLPFEL
ncbi:hypothetical protein OTSTA716_1323 [Orientia tsutsugamushi str. TA716]|uniref:Uncharacterized protein n=1 Tax=Orientia tsutsugamushi str. TA716 TaxID=1359175 RepID=A0A0F3NVN8_ORITS|nr:hypothetical protein OTSTA716_2682 [Orientia tsutsugamushi str. TA716]KJV71782.1 hypothetical protein OTSTA716_2148 [Orientia tsutsugamushi str. TA716]KJV74304.1 hypothetical protein OTSTA716_1323 [Orientia tsutsugamushi str. TA716]